MARVPEGWILRKIQWPWQMEFGIEINVQGGTGKTMAGTKSASYRNKNIQYKKYDIFLWEYEKGKERKRKEYIKEEKIATSRPHSQITEIL